MQNFGWETSREDLGMYERIISEWRELSGRALGYWLDGQGFETW
jgi:hypothetical protein